MELAKLTTKGQITIPVQIRKKLRLREGDKVFFVEEKGKIYFENASQVALKKIQDNFRNDSENVGFEFEQDVIDYIKALRRNTEKSH